MSYKTHVFQTSASTGTGNLTLAAVTGWHTFADAFGTGALNTFRYSIRHRTALETESGIGYMDDATTLVRVSVDESSNADAEVDFSAGTKEVAGAIDAAVFTGFAPADIAASEDYADAAASAAASAAVAAVIDSAPGTLDTLNELAAALGDDANFATTVANALAAKLALAGGTMTGSILSSVAANATAFGPSTNTGIVGWNANAFMLWATTGIKIGLSASGLRYGSNVVAGWSSAADVTSAGTDTALSRNAAGVVEVNNGTAGTWRDLKLRNLIQTDYHDIGEMSAPAAPSANTARLYAVDNGAGKTQLVVRFPTGAVQVLATEP